MVKKLPLILALFLVAAITLFCGCVAPEEGVAPGEGAAGEKITVKIFHAGSLTGPFEKIKAEFEEKYPNTEVLLEPAGSVECVKKVTETGKPADVVASADYALIPQYMVPDDADWYLTFAKNTMTLAYTDQSRHASEITADNWYTILGQDGVRWAFSDPNADPCGYRTPMVIKLAEGYYGDEAIFKNLVEDHSNIVATFEDGVWTIDATDPAPDGTKLTIRPKSVELVQMVQAGGIDYAWEYRSVAEQNAESGVKYIEMPEGIDLSAIAYKDTYAKVLIDTEGGIMKGKPIVYGVTVPTTADNPETGVEFVSMLIGPTGQQIMEEAGQPPITPSGRVC